MCFPNFLEKRAESVVSSLDARLVDETVFLRTTSGVVASVSIRRQDVHCASIEEKSTVVPVIPKGDAQVVHKRQMLARVAVWI